MQNKTVIKQLSVSISARLNCIESNNLIWQDRWQDIIEDIQKNYLPSGSGIDSSNKIDLEKSGPEKIIINSGFHVMDQNGFYAGWIDYKVIISASLQFDYNIKIIGNFAKNRNALGLKDYLQELYDFNLSQIYIKKEISDNGKQT